MVYAVPNSAGKSAAVDAFRTCAQLLAPCLPQQETIYDSQKAPQPAPSVSR